MHLLTSSMSPHCKPNNSPARIPVKTAVSRKTYSTRSVFATSSILLTSGTDKGRSSWHWLSWRFPFENVRCVLLARLLVTHLPSLCRLRQPCPIYAVSKSVHCPPNNNDQFCSQSSPFTAALVHHRVLPPKS